MTLLTCLLLPAQASLHRVAAQTASEETSRRAGRGAMSGAAGWMAVRFTAAAMSVAQRANMFRAQDLLVAMLIRPSDNDKVLFVGAFSTWLALDFSDRQSTPGGLPKMAVLRDKEQ
eukprot:SAG22_NODE_29_length_28404_cov_23.294153_17_plen_116_part_00